MTKTQRLVLKITNFISIENLYKNGKQGRKSNAEKLLTETLLKYLRPSKNFLMAI